MTKAISKNLRRSMIDARKEYRRAGQYRGHTGRRAFWTTALVSIAFLIGISIALIGMSWLSGSNIVGHSLLFCVPVSAIVFAWIGVMSTIRRLRDAGRHPALALLPIILMAFAAASWYYWVLIAGAGLNPGLILSWVASLLTLSALGSVLTVLILCAKPSATQSTTTRKA
jgi:uncharacterized membrane protein YhaH (DUF805 family)